MECADLIVRKKSSTSKVKPGAQSLTALHGVAAKTRLLRLHTMWSSSIKLMSKCMRASGRRRGVGSVDAPQYMWMDKGMYKVMWRGAQRNPLHNRPPISWFMALVVVERSRSCVSGVGGCVVVIVALLLVVCAFARKPDNDNGGYESVAMGALHPTVADMSLSMKWWRVPKGEM
eukprot:6402236-Amphidinium_carterae.1